MTRNVEFKSLFDASKIAQKLLNDRKKIMQQALEEEAMKIIERTSSGRDVSGARFPDYTPAYEIYKAGKGRGSKWSGAAKGRGKKASALRRRLVREGIARSNGSKKGRTIRGARLTPDLTFKGRMLAAIRTKVTVEGFNLVGRIFFNNQEAANKARGNMYGVDSGNTKYKTFKGRKFFLLNDEQKKRILDKLK